MALAFTDNDVELALNAQIGKSGLPLNGKDLHLGDLSRGVLPAAAPLSIAACTITGVGLGIQQKNEKRVALSFIGEGGSSLGEWHEAINIAAAQNLPVVFCIQNNQTALSTPVNQQSKVRTFGDKAVGYGLHHVTLDGTDPEALAAGFLGLPNAHEMVMDLPLLRSSPCECVDTHTTMICFIWVPIQTFISNTLNPMIEAMRTRPYEKWADKDPIKTYAKKLMDEKLIWLKKLRN